MFVLESNREALILNSANARLRIGFVTDSIVRVTMTAGLSFQKRASLAVVANDWHPDYTLEENAQEFRISTGSLAVAVDRKTGALRYLDGAGRLLAREPERGGKWLTAKDVYRYRFGNAGQTVTVEGVDGARTVAAPAERVLDRRAFEAKLEFVFAQDEALFGLGSHEEGYANLRGKSRELYQNNLKAVIPYFVSTRGYGVLLDCYSLMTFHDDAHGSYLWADVVDELDYYFIPGARFDDITRGYHRLTGGVPMPPKWYFGYAQSKERYVNAKELVDTTQEFRRRGIPLDVIVLDWKYWPDGGGWGQKSFDPVRFPDPKSLTAALHGMGARMMVSIWPNMTGESADRGELAARGLLLGNQSTYDAFQAEARRCYWEQANRGLFSHGIDAWWCDCTEPFESDWRGVVKPEPHERLVINTDEAKRFLDPGYIGAFSLLHCQGIYEGQRGVNDEKRVVNLTRSSYAGQHRYGTTTWSGDISATWETLRRSIAEGLNFCAAGANYWTVDIGAFFVQDDGEHWFWRGDYNGGCRGLTGGSAQEPNPADTGSTDLGYWELYTRWLQYAVFLPMFRSHGTDVPREPWRFGDEGSRFYRVIVDYIRLRYRLLPYIYSLAAQVTRNSWTMMRAVALDFPDDLPAHQIGDQFLFGPGLMACPVTAPMYYDRNSRTIGGSAKSRSVYLPSGNGWYDFHDGEFFHGGSAIEAAAPLDIIPVFARAGAIVPMSPAMQFSDEIRDAPYEIRVYRGADGTFPLYEDEGDNYNYERGECSVVMLRWSEAGREFSIGARNGGFHGIVREREFRVVLIDRHGSESQSVTYRGEEILVRAVGES
ncbi:MAG: glycoside hydrolase family 31 protein [Terriglobia bacterium]